MAMWLAPGRQALLRRKNEFLLRQVKRFRPFAPARRLVSGSVTSSSVSLFLYDQLIGVLTMARKATGKKAAKAASKVLRDKRTSKASKTAAGSALSQREKGLRKRK